MFAAALSYLTDGVGAVLDLIAENPFLMIFVASGVVFAAISVIKRLAR